MKKVTQVHIGGKVLQIEESAYTTLQDFIEGLQRRYKNDIDRDDIVAQIEARAAEQMSERIHKGAASISDEDIHEIIKSLHLPEAKGGAPANELEPPAKSETRRLYRSPTDKYIGGVCGGLAAYLGLDPSIVRILFVLFGFSGWGILAYIICWIVIPEKEQAVFQGRRLYRDTQNKVFGGVASGIANYSGVDVKIVRLIFLSPIILNILFSVANWPFFLHGFFFPTLIFGSLTGTFIFAYIVLWIILPASPKLATTADFDAKKKA